MDLGPTLLEDVRHRLTEAFPAQIRTCLEALTEEQVWWRPNPESNSIGNLVLHLVGSTRHFVGRAIGGSDYRRHRKAEFAERGPIPKADLLRLMDEVVAETERAVAGLDPGRLLEVTDRAGEPFKVVTLLLRTTHHWAAHAGQVLYLTKSFVPGAVDDLWRRTLRT